ncbi:hypothetical protein B7P43_G00493 [Cryptotermes secundus]|nr:hypothetical protein B7P43_G00493 [Cryptotermes secundus]
MLRYIYDQLHPYITVSDSEDDLEQSGAESSPFKKPGSDTQVPRSPVRKPNVLGTSRSPLMRSEDCCHRGNLVRQERSTAFQSGADSDSDDLLSSQRSSSSSAMSVREEAFFEELGVCSHGDIPLSQDVQPTPNLAAAVHSFITDDPNLHQKVLLYEPVLLEQLHANLKANNLKLKMNELMDYLDEQCITFRTAQGQQSRQKKKMQETKRRNLTKRKGNSHDKKPTKSSALDSDS